jgi:glutamine synthetase adenylyltransferase
MLEMRRKMNREHEANTHLDTASSPKHCPGGLIDIDFIAQLGILASAQSFPRILQATSTLRQIGQLKSIGWLAPDEAGILEKTARDLSLRRMMASLMPGKTDSPLDTQASARIFEHRLGQPGKQV